MKNETNQDFRSSNVLMLMGLIVLCLVIIATPWNRHIQDSSIEAALQKAEVVGYQVVQIYREAATPPEVSNAQNTRGPAAVAKNTALLPENLRAAGSVGTDPWGAAYHYRILASDSRGSVRIVVWSSGPNRKVETLHLGNEDVVIEGQPIYGGDDVGVLLSVTQN